MLLLDNNEPRYTWNNKWVWQYESFWGVVQKFKYFNCLERIDKKEFGLRHGNTQIIDSYNFITRKNIVYNPKDYSERMGVTQEHYNYLKTLKHNPVNDYIEQQLKVCPICIKYGYHSYIHQLIFEKRCFIHHKEELFITRSQYCIQNNMAPAFNDIVSSGISIQKSDDMLLHTIYNNNFFNKAYMISKDLQSISIINLNTNANNQNNSLNMSDNLCEYLHNVYWGRKYLNKYKPLLTISKNDMEEKWNEYNYTESPYNHWRQFPISEHGFLADLCYSYADTLCKSVDENVFNKTLTMVRASYVTKRYYPHNFKKYDLKAIGIIVSIATITGMEDNIENIYSTNWKRKRWHCIFLGKFEEYIHNAFNNGIRIAYIELYKIVLKTIYKTIRARAYKNGYTYKDSLEMNCDVKFPIYVITEDNNDIFLHVF